MTQVYIRMPTSRDQDIATRKSACATPYQASASRSNLDLCVYFMTFLHLHYHIMERMEL